MSFAFVAPSQPEYLGQWLISFMLRGNGEINIFAGSQWLRVLILRAVTNNIFFIISKQSLDTSRCVSEVYKQKRSLWMMFLLTEIIFFTYQPHNMCQDWILLSMLYKQIKKNSEKENEDTGSPLFMSTRTKTGAIGLYREHGALDYFGLCKQRKVQKVWERINIDLRVLWIMNRPTATSLCS